MNLDQLDNDLLSRIAMAIIEEGQFTIVYGPTGAGKTTLLCQGTQGILIQAQDDSANLLKRSGMIPAEYPAISATGFDDAVTIITKLAGQKSQGKLEKIKRIVIDNASGLTNWNDGDTIQNFFKGEPNKFSAFGGDNGDKSALFQWNDLLEAIQGAKRSGLDVFLIAHSANYKVSDALQDDHLKNAPLIGMPGKARYSATVQLADNCFLLDQQIQLSGDGPKKKAVGGEIRILRTYTSAAFEAKKRIKIPDNIEFLPGANGVDLVQNSKTFFNAFSAGVK